MAWRSAGSFSRSVISAARAPLLRSPPPLPRLRPPTSSTPRLQSRRLSFAPSRNLGELGCLQSFLPLHSTVLTSHLTVNVRACCELSHGRNGKDRYLMSRVQLDEGVRDSFVLWESAAKSSE